jgi:Fe-S-cluster containining protein
VTAVDLKKARAQANARISALVRGTLEHTDRYVEATKPANVTCTRGCAGCCRQLIVLSRYEATHIVHRYRDQVREALPVLAEQKLRYAEIAHDIPQDDPRVWQSHDLRNEVGVRWWKLNERCAFLTDANECSIYESRPFVCRAYFAVSDPKHCFSETADPDHEGWRPDRIPHSPAVAQLRKRPYVLGPLPKMMLQAWEDRS